MQQGTSTNASSNGAKPRVPRRRWGRSNLSIPVIPCGTQGFGNNFGAVADEEATPLVRHAIELGVNHFDCARCYGDSVRKPGLALRGMPRAAYVVSGRLCLHTNRSPLQQSPEPAADDAVRDLEEQLALLDIGHFGAVLIHDPTDMAPVLAKGGALEGLLSLKARGLARNVGFGMRPHDFHRQALATGEVDVMLTFNDYNLLRQTAAEPGGILDEAARRGAARRRRAQRPAVVNDRKAEEGERSGEVEEGRTHFARLWLEKQKHVQGVRLGCRGLSFRSNDPRHPTPPYGHTQAGPAGGEGYDANIFAHSRMCQSPTIPFTTNGSPRTNSSAASREVSTAIVLNGSSGLSRKAPAMIIVPCSCICVDRARWAAMSSGAFSIASASDAYVVAKKTT